uniref:DDE Tnp4 domain-containing protein n=1 Tax=Salmo trutta TaxID=8032 RepID=A0A673ZYN2_SALTR
GERRRALQYLREGIRYKLSKNKKVTFSGPCSLTDQMAAYLLWRDQNDRVPQRIIRDRLIPVEFYDNDEFSRRYRFSKDSVMQLERKVGPNIKWWMGTFLDSTSQPSLDFTGELDSQNGELFRNRKGYCSINVQVVCDGKVQLTNIVARWPGSTHDSRIFDNSHLCAMLERGTYEGHLLGDNGYACRGYLMTPLLNPQTSEEREYNTSHILARDFIERVFGVWKKRFPCLKEGLRTKMDTTLTIIIAVAVLYNFGKRQGDKLPEENAEGGQVQHAANANGNAVRIILTDNHFAA